MKKNNKNICIYCEDNKLGNHFHCDVCNVGMCDNCYDLGKEHYQHYNEVCESISNKGYDLIVEKVGYEPAYLCEKCLSKIMKHSEMKWIILKLRKKIIKFY